MTWNKLVNEKNGELSDALTYLIHLWRKEYQREWMFSPKMLSIKSVRSMKGEPSTRSAYLSSPSRSTAFLTIACTKWPTLNTRGYNTQPNGEKRIPGSWRLISLSLDITSRVFDVRFTGNGHGRLVSHSGLTLFALCFIFFFLFVVIVAVIYFCNLFFIFLFFNQKRFSWL